nr:MAG TPA: DNA REPAIR HELICASE RAD25, SSL2, PRE-INITIATION COMPLEX, RNA POLYMERASE.0A [Caudoviricetes sp.]
MTENEAIEFMKRYLDAECYTDKCVNAHIIAIKSLEIIKKLSDRKMTTEVLENYMQFEDECVKKGFAFKSVIEAREKQIAKKPTYEGDGYTPDGTLVYDTWICPCCDKRYEVDYDDYDYCPSCGQKLDLDRSDEE